MAFPGGVCGVGGPALRGSGGTGSGRYVNPAMKLAGFPWARKRFAAGPGWGIIRAHGNKRAFESEWLARNACNETFELRTRRIQGGNGERPSMEFHGTSGRISAIRAGRAEAG